MKRAVMISLAVFFTALYFTPNSEAASGKDNFATMCAACHGASGRGDGPAAGFLNPKPTDLTAKAVQGKSNADLEKTISEGKGTMPAFKSLAAGDLKEVVRYLRSLKK